MRGVEIRLDVDPVLLREFVDAAPAGLLQDVVRELARAHRKTGMAGADRLGNGADRVVIGPALSRRVDELAGEFQILMAAARIDVVMFEEHRGGQHDIGHRGGLGHEMLVHDREQILAREASRHSSCSGATLIGLVFWISIAVTGGP